MPGFFDSALEWLARWLASGPTAPPPLDGPPAPSMVAPPPPDEEGRVYKPWRLTRYYVSDEGSHPGPKTVSVLSPDGTEVAKVAPSFYSSAALEGTALLADGRLINVSRFVRVRADAGYDGVLAYHRAHLSKRPTTYSGIQTDPTGGFVTQALSFTVVEGSALGKGFGVCHGAAMEPWRTLAADIGTGHRSEPKFKGQGGLVPLGTRVHIREFVGLRLPDGSVHDGWFTVNDTGGGIFGAHFDVFVGKEQDERALKFPEVGLVWFEGIEARVPDGYDYGLKDA